MITPQFPPWASNGSIFPKSTAPNFYMRQAWTIGVKLPCMITHLEDVGWELQFHLKSSSNSSTCRATIPIISYWRRQDREFLQLMWYLPNIWKRNCSLVDKDKISLHIRKYMSSYGFFSLSSILWFDLKCSCFAGRDYESEGSWMIFFSVFSPFFWEFTFFLIHLYLNVALFFSIFCCILLIFRVSIYPRID